MATGEPDLIVFDGECVLCSRTAQFVLKRDKARRFRFTTAQGGTGQRLYRELGLEADAFETMIVVRGGRALTESDAALAIASGLGWPWRAAAAARIVPRPLRDAAYRLVARNRYRWFGRRDSCWVPDEGMRDRIV